MKYLLVTSWNSSVAAAWIAREFVLQNVTDHKFVVLCPKREDSWAEDYQPTDAHANVRIHHFEDDLIMEDSQPFSNTGLPTLDYVLLQLVFYAKTYEIDKILVIGSFFQNFSILARYALLEEKDKPTATLRAIVTHPGLQRDSEFREVEITNAVQKAYGLCEKTFVTPWSVDFVREFEIPAEVTVFEPPLLSTSAPRIPRSILVARAHLKDVVKMSLPSHSHVVCCFQGSDEDVISAIQDFKNLPNDATENDKMLLWIVQMAPKRAVYDLVKEEMNIIYTYTRLATEVVYAMIDACDTFISPDAFFARIIQSRNKPVVTQVSDLNGEVVPISDVPCTDFAN